MLTAAQEVIADRLWEEGAVKIDTVTGFPIKAQEDDPTIPNSPLYMNIRTEDHPTNPGPVTRGTMHLIGDEIGLILDDHGWPFSLYADIPHAGTPFGDQVRRLLAERGRLTNGRITMQKITENGKRRIISDIICDREYKAGEKVGLFDDLVTLTHTKVEAANGLKANGLRIGIIVPFLDRGQGGVQALRALDYNVVAVMRVPDMLHYYVSRRGGHRISRGTYDTLIRYLQPK